MKENLANYVEPKRCIIFSGPAADGAALAPLLNIQPADYIICADSGYSVCKSAGFSPAVVIGDFDSLSGEYINEIDNLGIKRIMHPSGKDDTDTMLCAKYGVAEGFDSFTIAGGIGEDFGHTIANLQTLSFLCDMKCEADIVTTSERIFMLDGSTEQSTRRTVPAVFNGTVPASFAGCPGGTFSVFSYTERCLGVSIENAKYPLSDAVLTQSYPIGVNNEFINDDPVMVTLKQGRLLIILKSLN